MKLYDFELSGNCYKVRLLLSILGEDYEAVAIDIRQAQSQTDDFKRLNPRGEIPALDDEDTIIWDSMAILVYLARKYQRLDLLPEEALLLARVMQWLAVSENELLFGLARARRIKKFNGPGHHSTARVMAIDGLKVVEQQLQQTPWLAGEHLTLADIACYPYIALAHEADIDIAPYPAILRWIKAIRSQPGYIDMPGMESTPLN